MDEVSSDAGFALVEVLIALAIGALCMTAVGSMIWLAVETRERTAQAASIENTLLEISAAVSRLSWDTRYHAVAHAGDFEIRSPSPLTEERLVATISVTTVLSVQFLGETIVVDLSPFQSAGLEYFVREGDNLSWASETAANSQPFAVRLMLRYLSWQWPVLLWVHGSESISDSWDL